MHALLVGGGAILSFSDACPQPEGWEYFVYRSALDTLALSHAKMEVVTVRSSIFRDALQVSPERIATLDDADITSLMRDLLVAHAHRCRATVSEIRVNTEGQAKDDGSDAWSPAPPAPDPWFGSTNTCWQFKAGSAGEPARLSGELTKRIPRETLAQGGRFVVVASGSTNGKKGEADRLETLRTEAKAAGLSTDAICVIGSDRLANWCNQHPAVAARWAGRPEGLWRLEDWLRSEEHRVPWQATAFVGKEIEDRRQDLDPASGPILHLHIQGPPGVGKTRFALELCRGADWANAVIYVRQAADVRLPELIDGATADEGVQLVVVADEVQAEQLRPLRDSLDRGNRRVRLVTVGHCKTPDPARIPAVAIAPLAPQQMAEVISGWHAGMPREHVDFIVRFADGFVRLARLAADEIARNPATDTRRLLDLDHIRGFLDGMLGGDNRAPLYVVAVLRTVGWTEDREHEGQAIARHLRLDWNTVRIAVDRFDRQFGIAPRGGRYRYISPGPLGIYLAVEAWTSCPDLMKTLPEALPTEEAREAYYERLQEIASNPQARKFARDELAFFFRAGDFVDARAAKRWSALAAADPALATGLIAKALSQASIEERCAIAGPARRAIVWGLVRLAKKRSAFRNAAHSLALLGEAENETWANNAKAEFVARYQVFLGGTAVPYVDRLSVIDELVKLERPELTRILIEALARVGQGHESSWRSEPPSDELPEPEWHPTTGADVLACINQALARLTAIARRGDAELVGALVTAAGELSMLLRDRAFRPMLASFFDAMLTTPQAREPIRRTIADVLFRERKYWRELPEPDLEEIEAIHARFEDTSLAGRLRQQVGTSMWDKDDQPDLSELAGALAADRGTLEREWPWLTSGEAGDSWRFGEALASHQELDAVLPALPARGRDLRALAGYASARRANAGDDWFDDWIMQMLRTRPDDLAPLFELSWRCGPTPTTARLVAQALREKDVHLHLANLLANGRWGENLPRDVLTDVLRALIDRGGLEAAASVLEHRIAAQPGELDTWEPLVVELVTNGDLIRSGHMANYYWKELANRIADRHATAIVAAILREQSDRSKETWFAEHSEAKSVLAKCVATDPAGAWCALVPHLSSPREGFSFSIGFPRGFLDEMPADEVFAWIAAKPDERASLVARLASRNLATDDTLTSRLLGAYGDNETIAGAFFSAYVSGTWAGPASTHWLGLANELDGVAGHTKLPKLREWALKAVEGLQRMAERDAQREEEEDLRR